MMPKLKPSYLMLWSFSDTKNSRNGFYVQFGSGIRKYRNKQIVTFVYSDDVVSYMMLPSKYYFLTFFIKKARGPDVRKRREFYFFMYKLYTGWYKSIPEYFFR